MNRPWAAPRRISPNSKILKSVKSRSSADRPVRSSLAENIFSAYSLTSSPAISASSLQALLSKGVQVGERNRRVSDRMADISRPAICLGISTSFSLYIL